MCYNVFICFFFQRCVTRIAISQYKTRGIRAEICCNVTRRRDVSRRQRAARVAMEQLSWTRGLSWLGVGRQGIYVIYNLLINTLILLRDPDLVAFYFKEMPFLIVITIKCVQSISI